MKEVDDKLENISQSLSRVLVQIYKDWGKDILFIVCITIILFTTQAVLLPNNLLLSAGEINWKVALVVIGLSIYWYVVSILTTTYVFLCLNYSDPENPVLRLLSNSVVQLAFLLSILILIAVALVLFVVRFFVPYNEVFHFVFFLVVHVPMGYLFLRSWRLIRMKKTG